MGYAALERILNRSVEREERTAARTKLAETGSYFWACDVRSARLWNAFLKAGKVENGLLNGCPVYRWCEGHKRERWRHMDRSSRPFCGAKTRSGQPCKARACLRIDGTLARRCRMHGGLSTGPKNPRSKFTPENRAAYIAAVLECGQYVEAARRVGLPYKTICRWNDKDRNFLEACSVAYRLHYVRRPGFIAENFSEWLRTEREAKAWGVI